MMDILLFLLPLTCDVVVDCEIGEITSRVCHRSMQCVSSDSALAELTSRRHGLASEGRIAVLSQELVGLSR